MVNLATRIPPTVLVCRAYSGVSGHRKLGVAQTSPEAAW